MRKAAEEAALIRKGKLGPIAPEGRRLSVSRTPQPKSPEALRKTKIRGSSAGSADFASHALG